MSCFDIELTHPVPAAPETVWDHLVSELGGARRWWVPTHTFRPTTGRVDEVGGRWLTTVHINGVDRFGPRLNFIARTRHVEATRRLEGEYVGGCFRGVVCFLLGSRPDRGTDLTMIWSAEPHGWVRRLPPAIDIGNEHTSATAAALKRLADVARFEAFDRPDRARDDLIDTTTRLAADSTTDHVSSRAVPRRVTHGFVELST